ncbi:hypothetical protein [Lysobacter gummosus]|uniref:hypothetical protein n=1 Tax=Lysobacter gummosus TaxID=262324 RepID=UPI00363E2037
MCIAKWRTVATRLPSYKPVRERVFNLCAANLLCSAGGRQSDARAQQKPAPGVRGRRIGNCRWPRAQARAVALSRGNPDGRPCKLRRSAATPW